MAFEFASEGVRVNSVCPGMTQTPTLVGAPSDVIAVLAQSIPLDRTANPEDMANLALCLASDKARHISGQVICADGGSSL